MLPAAGRAAGIKGRVDLTAWSDLAEVVGSAVSLLALVAVAAQMRTLVQQSRAAHRQAEASVAAVRASVYLTTQQTMIEVGKFMADHPEVRLALYGPVPGPVGDQAAAQRIEAGAELLLDVFDQLTANRRHVADELYDGWTQYLGSLMAASPYLRDFWRRNREWYPHLEPALGAMVEEVASAPGACVCGGSREAGAPVAGSGAAAGEPAPAGPDPAPAGLPDASAAGVPAAVVPAVVPAVG
ncbi:MAG TPA: hypothetical protein VFY17_02120 [Pilimelia sp.]|nr:hypothetical protein [Pilimelia sp.]